MPTRQGHRTTLRSVLVVTVLWFGMDTAVLSQGPSPSPAQPPLPRSLKTPLPPEALNLLANEASGQIIFSNLVKLGGARGSAASGNSPECSTKPS